jgi:gamma-glutamylcyclotransferase (GGCT)/AIG2-like uncharacterized protein YtfP
VGIWHEAGCGSLFLYGTLTDPDVLQRVLARMVGEGELAPALIDGFRRVQAQSGSYPLLVQAPGAAVLGLLLLRPSRRDILRLNHFESEEYRAERHAVHLVDGSRREAWLYMGLPHLLASDETWDFATWQAQHKAAFLAQCDAWMADYPEPD